MDHQHQFKRSSEGQGCSFCNDLWPSVDGLVSKYQHCELCGTVVHTSCKLLGNRCIPCNSRRNASMDFHWDKNLKGQLRLKLRQSFDMGGSAGNMLYGVWKYSDNPFQRTATATSSENECVWEENLENTNEILVDFAKDVSVDLKLELWSSYYDISIIPAVKYPNYLLERWFTLRNILTGHVGKVLVEISFISNSTLEMERIQDDLNLAFDLVLKEKDQPRQLNNCGDENEIPICGVDPNNNLSIDIPPSGGHILNTTLEATTDYYDSAEDISIPQQNQIEDTTDHMVTLPSTTEDHCIENTDTVTNSSRENPSRLEDQEKIISEQCDSNVSKGIVNITTPAKLISDFHISSSGSGEEENTVHNVSISNQSIVDHVMETPFASLDMVKAATKCMLITPPSGPAVESSTDLSDLNTNRYLHSSSNFPERSTPPLPPLSLSERFFGVATESDKSYEQPSTSSDSENGAFLKHLEQGYNIAIQRWTTLWQGHNILPHPNYQSLSRSSQDLKHAVDKNCEKMHASFIGLMHIRLKEIQILGVNEPGEYYCGIAVDGRDISFSTPVSKSFFPSSSSWKKNEHQTIINSQIATFNCNFSIGIPHFRSIVHIMIIESRSKRKVGFATTTAFEVVQREADNNINGNLYPPFKSLSLKDKSGKEELGIFYVDLNFEENIDDYFWSPSVKSAPSGLEEDMSMDRFAVHIARFSAIIELLSGIYTDYLRIMDWSDPIYTATLFLIFLYCTLRVPAEYGLSGIMFFLVLVMTKAWMRRKYGAFNNYYVSKGKKDPSLEYLPLAKLKISLIALKYPLNSIHDETVMRIPSVKVSYFAIKEKDQNDPSNINSSNIDSSLHGKEYFVGCFGECIGSETNSGVTGVPIFVSPFVSQDIHRKDGLLQNVFDPWPFDVSKLPDMENRIRFIRTREIALVYPILQPLLSRIDRQNTRIRSNSDVFFSNAAVDELQSESSAHCNLSTTTNTPVAPERSRFLPWSENTGVIKLTLLNHRQEDNEFITISLRDIQNSGTPNNSDIKKCTVHEILRWFEASPCQQKISDNAAASLILTDLDNFLYDDFHSNGRNVRGFSGSSVHPSNRRTQILVRVSLEVPDERKTFSPTEEERKTSFFVQQALSDHKIQESSTLAVLWNMRDHVRYVQNMMNNILDWIESCKNLFNWTSPSKTLPLYFAVVAFWFVTIVIPGRILVFLWGLYQFFYIFLPIPDGNEYVIRFQNIVNSLPNDDDLEQIYSNERKIYFNQQEKQQKREFREYLLKSTLPIIWSGNLQIKTSSGINMNQNYREWSFVHLVIQGKRVLWWKSESDAEDGKVAQGQVILTGLAGITQVSPLDMRMFNGATQLTAIFGQDYSGQPIKVSMYFGDEQDKCIVENIIHKISN